ncbi:MAG: hypothetical protein KGL39_24350 [Patescibacteria group bacterium]|nr:hypothetical protein [Patescibacteria group bacterium]
MATWTSDKISSGTIKMLPLGYNQSILATAAVTTSLALNDVVQMVNLSADASLMSGYGPTILGISLGADQLDTGGSPALTLDVGDATTANRFIAASTVGQAGGVFRGTLAPCLGYQPFASSFGTYTTNSNQTYLIEVKVHAAAATAAAGNIRLLVDFTVDP